MINVDFIERIFIIYCSLKKILVDWIEWIVLICINLVNVYENDELLICI